jgi:GAF domain-containing protein
VDLFVRAGYNCGMAGPDDEVSALQDVARAILSVHDPDQVLLTVNDRLLALFEADIAGVWLFEGEDLVMKSVSGHRAIELQRVRIRPGQGLAGRIIETGEPLMVEDYVQAEEISDHFVQIAERESVRSALGVPMRDRSGMLGVLEVWRRRASTFSADDVRRMEAFASLAVVAISNARLYESQQRSLDELATARRSLQTQVEFLQRSTALQGRLTELVLQHAGLGALAEAVAEETGAITVLAPVGGGEEVIRPVGRVVPGLPALLREVTSRSEADSAPRVREASGRCWSRQVQHERGLPGAVLLLTERQDTEIDAFLEMACGQLATALRLHHLEEEAAISARDEMLEDVLWDLLIGDPSRRRAAATRLRRVDVTVEGTCRVLHGSLRQGGAGTSPVEDSERIRTRIGGALRLAARQFGTGLTGTRGDWVVLIGPADAGLCRKLAAAVDEKLAAVLDGVHTVWGISGPCTSPHDLHRACAEARTSGSVMQRLPSAAIPAYDELGLVRFLFPDSPAGDMERFVDGVLGPLIAYDRRRSGGHLLRTLEVYFENDCSQREAAEHLRIHAKTLRYRLQQIHELTGLDLTRHTDRVRADMALRIHQMCPPRDG